MPIIEEPGPTPPKQTSTTRALGGSVGRYVGVPTKSLPGANKTATMYGPGPVSVWVDPKEVPKKIVFLAIKMWNDQSGQTLFSMAINEKEADVVVHTMPHQIKTEDGSEHAAWGVPGRWTASGKGQVRLYAGSFGLPEVKKILPQVEDRQGYLEQLAMTVQHELGHTVGLDHPGPAGNPYMFKGGMGEGLGAGGIGRAQSGVMGSEGYAWRYDRQTQQWTDLNQGATQSEINFLEDERRRAAAPGIARAVEGRMEAGRM